jgi:hypothetical protein
MCIRVDSSVSATSRARLFRTISEHARRRSRETLDLGGEQ